VLEDAERLIAAWNERQALRAPMIFSPTIGAAIAAGYWFLWVRCPACRTINAIDLRTLDRHPDAAVSSLIPALSCRSCRPNAPFAELSAGCRGRRIDKRPNGLHGGFWVKANAALSLRDGCLRRCIRLFHRRKESEIVVHPDKVRRIGVTSFVMTKRNGDPNFCQRR